MDPSVSTNTHPDDNMIAKIIFRLAKRKARIEQRRKMSQNTTSDMANHNAHATYKSSEIGPTPIIVHEVNLAEKRKENQRARKSSNVREKYFTLGKKKGTKTRLDKQDISAPSVESFIHVTGVRPSEQGFQMVDNMQYIDPRLREFLQVAGLDESILANPQQKEEIYKFVEDNKVFENIEHRRKTRSRSKRPEVAPKPSIKLRVTPSFPPPPPPMVEPYRMPSPRPENYPDDEPPSTPMPPPPPSCADRKYTNNASSPPKSMISSGIPPPPPPPPPAMPTSKLEIKPNIPTPPKKVIPNGAGDAKSDLMAAIRQRGGVQGGGLKPVGGGDKPSKVPTNGTTNGSLVNVLQGALLTIKSANQSDSSDDSSSDEQWSEEEC